MDSEDHSETPSNEMITFLKELGVSLIIILFIGLLLFSITGVWPPMVAVQSGSMEPHMERGDLIIVVEPTKFSPEYSHSSGIVTYQTGQKHSYSTFGKAGDVIVYTPNGSLHRTPIIHRVRFQVNESENWVDKANKSYLPVDSCSRLPNCPAPSSGFITKGDANPYYDQVVGISDPVKQEWIKAKAKVKIPYLGRIRLIFSN